jgi:rubredoxin
VGDDIRHEQFCPNRDAAHNPDIPRIAFKTVSFTVTSLDPSAALATLALWQCTECLALVDEQQGHRDWHIEQAKRFYELQRRTNRVRVKRPKEVAPTQGPVTKESHQSSTSDESQQSTDTTSSQRRRVAKKRSQNTNDESQSKSQKQSEEEESTSKRKKVRVPKRTTSSTHTSDAVCEVAHDNDITIGGFQHTCTCNEPATHVPTTMHHCPVCGINWRTEEEAEDFVSERNGNWSQSELTPVPHSVLMEMMREVQKADIDRRKDIELVSMGEAVFNALLEDQGLKDQAQEMKNRGGMGTIFGIPFEVDDSLPIGQWSITTRPCGTQPGNKVTMPPLTNAMQVDIDGKPLTEFKSRDTPYVF